jgi:hypothetical protein
LGFEEARKTRQQLRYIMGERGGDKVLWNIMNSIYKLLTE